MKLTVAILLIACLHVSAGVHSQSRITLNMQSADIKKVLTAIEKKTSYRFLYNQNLLLAEQKVNITAVNEEVLSVVNRLLNNTSLSYEVLDNNLVVLKQGSNPVQQVTVKGRITNNSGEPIAGGSVRIKGSNAGTATDADGRFSLTVPDNAVLIISYVGYETQEIPVDGKTEVTIVLQPSTRQLDQVVVIGYGTASKRDLTGSISKVTGREVADKPNTNPLASVQGKVAGVSVVNVGKLNEEPDIRIRGTISRTQTKPLYVVDGIFNDNINYINPADIESIEVLKDPSSLAIFGVRGANGVIIVTTKRAKTGQFTVNFSSSVGFKKIANKIKLTDATQFKMLLDEQLVNQGAAPYDKYNLYTGNTDWVDAISQDGFVTNNTINISGGSDRNKYYMGIGYIREDGIVKNERLEKLLLSFNDELKVSKALKFGFNFNGTRTQLPQLPAGGPREFIGAVTATPIVVPYNTEKGLYNRLPDAIGGPQIPNPLMLVNNLKGTDLQHEYRAVGSIFGEINFLRHFNFKATYYGDLGFNNERRYTPLIQTFAADFNNISTEAGYNTTKVFQKENRYTKFQQEYLLTFKKVFGDHSLTALGGFTTYYNSYTETNGEVRQYASNRPIPRNKRFWYLDNLFGDPTSRVSGLQTTKDVFENLLPLQWEQTTVSYLFRALYNYQGKYMLNASFRRDGSSEISPNNRYQNFAAVGVAWELTREDFMQNQKVFDFAKLKASWGILGNQYTQIHYPFYPLLRGSATAIFDNNVFPAYVPSFLADSSLKWESVNSKEIGVEFTVLKNRLTMEVNYFHKLTDNLLTNYPGVGGQKPGITNAGKIKNTGIEAAATWNDKLSNGFNYTISANITTLNNEVTEIYQKGFAIIQGVSRTAAGFPIGYFFGYIHDGIYQNNDDKTNSPDASALGSYGPGDIKFRDIAGAPDADGNPTGPDGKIDVNDRTMIGNPTPDFIYGFSLAASYKGFDAGIDFQGVQGNEIYRSWGNGASYAIFNYREDRLNRWHGAGTSNWEPLLNDQHNINRESSTYMIEDGSYIRIRNVQLGYNFSTAFLSRMHIKALRVFVNGQNLKTFKKNSGFTPEFGGDINNPAISFGVDAGSYPMPAIYSFGINLTF